MMVRNPIIAQILWKGFFFFKFKPLSSFSGRISSVQEGLRYCRTEVSFSSVELVFRARVFLWQPKELSRSTQASCLGLWLGLRDVELHVTCKPYPGSQAVSHSCVDYRILCMAVEMTPSQIWSALWCWSAASAPVTGRCWPLTSVEFHWAPPWIFSGHCLVKPLLSVR